MEWVLIVWAMDWNRSLAFTAQFATEEACRAALEDQEQRLGVFAKHASLACYRTGVPSQAQFLDELGKALKDFEPAN